MCGLTGFWDPLGRAGRESPAGVVEAMARTLAHRGPDDRGSWADERAGLALGHTRLSILDLSEKGRQPMVSAQGRYVLAYNGEVYNFPELRNELEGLGHRFRGTSDTEVVLGCVEEWGLEASLPRFVGMFALALWDRRERRLHLVRDRLGLKPIYYGVSGQVFLFGSELKSLTAHPVWSGEVDRGALALFLKNGYIPAPHTIYKGIFKLPAGCALTMETKAGAGALSDLPRPRPYWSLAKVMEQGLKEPYQGSLDQAASELESFLGRAVEARMIADVELGVFLSGGLDSSLVTALMQTRSSRPVKTFTIGFWEETHNEAIFAREVAAHLGTDHTELYLTSREAREVIPDLPRIFDEPFADSSQLPTRLLAALARRRVKVALSGDGGDELFGGYDRYPATLEAWSRLRLIPGPLRGAAARLITGLPKGLWAKLPAAAGLLRSRMLAHRSPEELVQRGAGVLASENPAQVFAGILAHWKNPEEVVIGPGLPLSVMEDPLELSRFKNPLTMMRYLDLAAYHPDDILVKVDRASMSVGLEVRVPLIDHRVVEFAARLPDRMLISKGKTKVILRQVLRKYIPEPLIDRPKMGFGVPLGRWLRGPLRDWAQDLLAPERLIREGFLRPEPVARKWEEHLSGQADWKYLLWNVLVFQAWLESR